MASLPLPVLLARLSQELASLQLMAAEMEAAVDGIIERHAGVLDPRTIQNLQFLDILNQTLLALARFTSNTAGQSSPAWSVDAAPTTTGLTLASLARRLSRAEGEALRTDLESYELFSEG